MLYRLAFVSLVVAAVLGVVFASSRFAGKHRQDIEPDTSPGEKAVLVFAGAKIPVIVEYSKHGSDENLDLKVDGTLFESEHYITTEQVFAVAAVAGETMNPPLPLLKYPFKLGDKYKWQGTLTFGEGDEKADGLNARTATAEITTSEGTVPMSGENVPAILSVAKVSIDGGGEKPAIRELKFWIIAKRGVMMREIGQGVKRQPQ